MILRYVLNRSDALTSLPRARGPDPAQDHRTAEPRRSPSAMARPLAMSLPAVMQHLACSRRRAWCVRRNSAGCAPAPSILEALTQSSAGSTTGGKDGKAAWTGWGSISQPRNRRRRRWKRADRKSPVEPPPVRIKLHLHAPRERVFKAWSSTEHVQRWFAPAGYSVPHANVEMRVGGPFEVSCGRPTVQHWARGAFVEVSTFSRLAIDLVSRGHARRRAFSRLDRSELFRRACGTQIDVLQTYTVLDPDGRPDDDGRPAGLGADPRQRAELSRMQMPDESLRSVVHAVFTLERAYDAPVDVSTKVLPARPPRANGSAASRANGG